MIASLIFAALAASANPYPTLSPAPELKAPKFVPNGTYVYGIYKGSQRVGSTTVVVERRDGVNRIDIFESGSFAKLSVRVYGGLAYRGLLPTPWNVTYAGFPFPSGGRREAYASPSRFTVRYEIDQDGSLDLTDGIRGGDVWPLWSWPASERHVKYYTVYDPPFMAGVVCTLRGVTPKFRARSCSL